MPPVDQQVAVLAALPPLSGTRQLLTLHRIVAEVSALLVDLRGSALAMRCFPCSSAELLIANQVLDEQTVDGSRQKNHHQSQ